MIKHKPKTNNSKQHHKKSQNNSKLKQHPKTQKNRNYPNNSKNII